MEVEVLWKFTDIPSRQHVIGLIFKSIRQAEEIPPACMAKTQRCAALSGKFWHVTAAKCQVTSKEDVPVLPVPT